MEEAISNMVNVLYDNKQNISDNDYIILMDNLKEISKFKPKLFNKKHRVSYKLRTDLCFIEDLSQYEDIKKDVFNNCSNYYNESEEDFNEDYERVKTVETDGFFYCYSNEIISHETHEPLEILKLVGEAQKHTDDYYIDPDIMQEHLREVQEYYHIYKKEWDEWIRIISNKAILIDSVDYMEEDTINSF